LLDALETAQRALSMNTPQGDADCLSVSDEILQHDPSNPHAMYMAGTALYRMKQNGLAALILNSASQLNPGEAAIWNNLAISLREQHPKDAVMVLRKALECAPDHVEARKNLAACLGRIGQRDEAIELNRKLREERPDDPEIPYNLALDLLHTDNWAEAFEAYVYSEGNAQRKVRNYHADKQTPRWDGTDSGEKVVLYGEQGVGDEMLAAVSYAAHISQSPSCEFIIDCDPRLEGIFKRSFPEATVYGTRDKGELVWPAEEEPDCALIGMAAFGALVDPSVKAAPWLKPDPVLVKMFTDLLASYGDGPKIGLSWSGGAKDWDRAERTIPVEELGPILTTPNATIVSLEYSDGPKPDGVLDLSWATRKGVDLDVTAALIAALDLVVSVPQTALDIAGAVGTPIKALVSHNPPWRFAEAAGDAWIWQDVKTYRKKPGGNWMPVIVKCARDIREGL
jgi:hypothetical protein